MEGTEAEQQNSDLSGELEVLRAIYGEEIQSVDGGSHTEVLMTLAQEGIGLQFLLSERYPEDPPAIHVSSSETCNVAGADTAVLVAHLEDVAKASIGEPMLHTLITEAKDFVASHAKEGDISMPPATQASAAADDRKPICKFYLEGKCRFGDNCFNRHPQQQSSTKSVSAETKTHCREGNAESRESSGEKKGKKKPPMRTALDVINRIQWDDDLLSKNFVIGYLDRFTGVQERPFDDFTWGDLSAAEIDDLAIPQHRIQYFKYHDQKVWDKNERLDNVFGSTGSDVTIHDVLRKYKKEDGSNGSAQEKDGGGQAATEGRPEPDRESSSDDEDFDTTASTKRKPVNKNKPNYFVAVRITDPDVLRVIKDFQDRIFQRSPVLDAALIPTEKLHVTLCTLRIDSQGELDSATRVLRELKRESARLLPPSLVLRFGGVRNFDNRVVYAAPDDNPAFCRLAAQVSSRLSDAGLKMAGGHGDYVPHLTLLKLSRSLCKALAACNAFNADSGVDPSLYAEFEDQDFGAQAVEELHLCSMGSVRQDGFYQCAVSVGLFEEN